MSTRTMSGWWEVFVKEVRENLRDRRALGMALLYGPLFGPVLFAAITTFIVGKRADDAERPLAIAIVHAERAPNLVEFIRQQGVTIKTAPADPEAAIRDQQEAVILRIAPDYAEDWREGRPARVELLLDESRLETRQIMGRVRALLDGYAGQIADLRLRLRGLDPQVVAPLSVARRDLSTAQGRGATFMALLPYFLLLCAFLGGMYLAIDATAGERERQSLEALMTVPVAPGQIMAGKLAATTLFAVISVLVCIVAFQFGIRFVPTDDLGFSLSLSPKAALQVLVLVAPVAFLASAIQTVIASFARSFREAQTYLQFLMVIPSIPSVVLAIAPFKPVAWMLLTPLLSQSLLINQLARGEAIAMVDLLLCVGGTIAAGLASAAVAVRLYGSERLALAG